MSGHGHDTAPGQTAVGKVAAKGMFDMEECINQTGGRTCKHNDGGWPDLDLLSAPSTGGATASSGAAGTIAETSVADSGGDVLDAW